MADQYLGTPVTAFLVLTILAWAAVTVSGTTQELSTTTGDTVNIPCMYGDGTLSSIFWAYNDGTGRHKILSLANWDLTIEPKYSSRASLQNDNSTLILKDITVADAGTYRCDVDRQGQTVVTNINTNLNVFSLRPDTLPGISPCTVADESSSCSIHANQTFTLTCTLPNVYPVEATKLIWYQDGQRVSFTNDVNTQNDDGTTDISKQIQVCETGNFTCNATYFSANGRENTVRSVEAWIIPLSDVPNTPGKNMTSGEIFCKTMEILLIVISIFLILSIALLLYCLKARGQRSSGKETNKSERTQRYQVTSGEALILLETSAEIGSKDGNVTSGEALILLDTSAEIGSKDGNVEYSTLSESFTVRNRLVNSTMARRRQTEEMTEPPIDDTPRKRMSSVANVDFDQILKGIAKALYRNSDIDGLGKALGFEPADIGRKIAEHAKQEGDFMGTLDLLRTWRNRQTPSTEKAALRSALVKAGLVNLADQYLSTPVPGQTEIDVEEAITNGTAPWNRSRIMVIGPARVGKTSLIRRLTGQEFNPEEKSTKGTEQNIVTNNKVSSWKLVNDAKTAKDDLSQSMTMYRDSRSYRSAATEQLVTGDADRSVSEKNANISQGITREEITNVESSELGITYSMWDFGGQEIYYITHPLFLSWRSLYILVIPLHLELSDRAPREEDAGNAQKELKGSAVRTHRTILDAVNFWLMSVYTHAVPDSHLDSNLRSKHQNEPKVLLIGTFAGGESVRISKEKVDSKVQELKDFIRFKPYRNQVLFPICVIDNQCSPTSEVNAIQNCIDEHIKNSEYMKVPKPVRWRTFLTEIEGSDQNTLTVKEARSMMNSLGINDDEEMDDVLKFYHDIGHLIYHQGCELIVLKPQFLNSIVSSIITVIDDKKMPGVLAQYWKDLKAKGILSIELIQAVWEEHGGDLKQLDNMIDLMIMFDLICEIPVNDGGRRRFFVPCRSSPMLHEKECYDKDHTVEFTIDFHHFLPDGFLHRFYVRMAKWSMKKKKSIKPTFHCRQMVFYVDSRHRLVMTNEINSTECHQIKVKVNAVVPFSAQSERKPATVNLNENIFDDLHDTLDDLKKRWARRIQYSVGILCPNCSTNELIPMKDILTDQDEFASCDNGCPIDVSDILRAFNKEQHPRRTPAAKTRKVESAQDPERKKDDEEDKPARKDYTGLEMKKAIPTKEQLDPEKNYKMDVLAKGHMFILNMSKDRKGSAADVDNIVHVFEQIGGFKIETHSDLTAKDLKDKLEKFVDSPRHKDMSSAVFLLMGHGSKTGIQCTDKEVTTEFISDMVSRMEHMNGKPKMIFFQCCRGQKQEKKVETDQAETDTAIPAKSDILQVYATTEGNVAYRHPDDGSWFIQMLCEELLENAHASDLCTMLEQVTGKVGKMASEENHGRCVVVVNQGISKKIYFLPKYSPKA